MPLRSLLFVPQYGYPAPFLVFFGVHIMPVEKISFIKPDPERSFPFTWQNFLKVAYPDATIWAINVGDGWFIQLGKPDLSAILYTERGTVKLYSKLDTVIEQLSQHGFNQVITRDLRGAIE